MLGEIAVWSWRKSLPNSLRHAQQAIEVVLERLGREGWGGSELFGIHLALDEALDNAVRHGNEGQEGKLVHVACDLFPTRVRVQIQDEGAGFRPSQVADPRAPEYLNQPHGRGLLLMRNFLTRVEFVGCGNCVVLEKERLFPWARVA